jgi:hypothetical protein
MTGAAPPAGTQVFINYFQYYHAGTLNGNDGGKAAIPGLGNVKFNLDVAVEVLRYVDVTKWHILGGDFLWHFVLPIVYTHVNAAAGPVDLFTGTSTDLANIETGIGIHWHCKDINNVFAVDVVAPTGYYDMTDPSSIGRAYWSLDPLDAFTYLGGKNAPLPGFEVSTKVMYWLNSTNTQTHYRSGQEFAFDYAVGQHFGPWVVGATGFGHYQTTNDESFGKTAVDPFTGLPTGYMAKEFAVGPGVSVDIPHGCLTFKYFHDVMAQNVPVGDHFWLKWIFAW